MISGIVCLARDCNAKICKRETSRDYISSHRCAARRTFARRQDILKKWRKYWESDEFRRWISELTPQNRITRRSNFLDLADHYKGESGLSP